MDEDAVHTLKVLGLLIPFLFLGGLSFFLIARKAGPPSSSMAASNLSGLDGGSVNTAETVISDLSLVEAMALLQDILSTTPYGQGHWQLNVLADQGLIEGEMSFDEKQLGYNASVPGHIEKLRRSVYLSIKFELAIVDEGSQNERPGSRVSWTYKDKASSPHAGMMEHLELMSSTSRLLKEALKKQAS